MSPEDTWGRSPQENRKLDALDIVMRKLGHEPIPFIRPGMWRMDAFRCRECGYVRRITTERLVLEAVPPCMSAGPVRQQMAA